jgi:hypothetical protein
MVRCLHAAILEIFYQCRLARRIDLDKGELAMSFFGSRLRFVLVGASLICLFCGLVPGQSRQSGEIRGMVTDQSQAVLPGVTVAITNVSTGVVQTITTDASGVYDAPYVTPGDYSLRFAKDGFKTLVRAGVVLHVQTITVNAVLEVGTSAEKVTVTATQPDLETETTDLNSRFTANLIADAPSINRSWMDLLASVPGVNPGGGESSTGQGVGVNGQAGYFSNWQIDGGIAMLGQSSNPDSLVPPMESIEEVSINTSNFGAEHGSGFSVFNVITKSGTNSFHGTVYEYIENDFFDALNKFAQTKPPIRWNEYGFDIGGPIKKNKAFFFFGYQRNPSNTFAPTYVTYPTTGPNGFTSGNFSALLGGPAVDGSGNPIIDPCTGQQAIIGQIFDPATTYTPSGTTLVCRMPFTGDIIPPARFDSVALAVQKYFPVPNLPANGLYNNYYTNLSSPNTNTWTNAKIDYDITSKNRLTGSLLIAQFNTPLNDPNCAINCGAWSGTEPQGQLTDVWTVTPNLVSEFRFSLSREHGVATVNNQGQGWPAKLGLIGAPNDMFPSISMEGPLSTSIGYTPFPPAIDAETTFVPSEVLTWVKGKHILKFGGEFDRWWVNTGWGTATAGAFDFSGVFTQNPADQALNSPPSEGEGYADFLLGAPDWWGVSINPETGGRMYTAQAFAQDEYKVKPNLTLTLGLRYVIQSGWNEIHNELSSFEPNVWNPDSQDSPPTPMLGGLWYAGQNGHRALTETKFNIFSPRLGFAWAPGKEWSVRGGFGIYNIIAGQNITAPAQAWGQGWSPAGALYNTSTPVFQLSAGPPPGSVIYPTDATRTPDLLNGTSVNYSFYNSAIPYTEQFHFDVQHELKGGFVLDVGYAGNRGVNLQYSRDVNQVPPDKLGQGQSARPYPLFLQVMAAYFDGWSNYNALQVIVKKQLSQDFTIQANYSWAKALDTLTSQGWGGAGSADRVQYQNADDPAGNYGRAATDIRNMFNGNLVYHLPFGRGKRFLQQGGLVNALVGGWQLSSIFQVRGGLPFSPIISTNNDGAMSGTWRPNLVGNPASGTCPGGVPVGTINCWFNTSAFATPPANTFGNTGRDILNGPNWRTFDVSLLKDFSLDALHEGMKLQFNCTASDVFNHPNIGFPEADLENSGFGQISYANTSRQLQLGAKISF